MPDGPPAESQGVLLDLGVDRPRRGHRHGHRVGDVRCAHGELKRHRDAPPLVPRKLGGGDGVGGASVRRRGRSPAHRQLRRGCRRDHYVGARRAAEKVHPPRAERGGEHTRRLLHVVPEVVAAARTMDVICKRHAATPLQAIVGQRGLGTPGGCRRRHRVGAARQQHRRRGGAIGVACDGTAPGCPQRHRSLPVPRGVEDVDRPSCCGMRGVVVAPLVLLGVRGARARDLQSAVGARGRGDETAARRRAVDTEDAVPRARTAHHLLPPGGRSRVGGAHKGCAAVGRAVRPRVRVPAKLERVRPFAHLERGEAVVSGEHVQALRDRRHRPLGGINGSCHHLKVALNLSVERHRRRLRRRDRERDVLSAKRQLVGLDRARASVGCEGHIGRLAERLLQCSPRIAGGDRAAARFGGAVGSAVGRALAPGALSVTTARGVRGPTAPRHRPKVCHHRGHRQPIGGGGRGRRSHASCKVSGGGGGLVLDRTHRLGLAGSSTDTRPGIDGAGRIAAHLHGGHDVVARREHEAFTNGVAALLEQAAPRAIERRAHCRHGGGVGIGGVKDSLERRVHILHHDSADALGRDRRGTAQRERPFDPANRGAIRSGRGRREAVPDPVVEEVRPAPAKGAGAHLTEERAESRLVPAVKLHCHRHHPRENGVRAPGDAPGRAQHVGHRRRRYHGLVCDRGHPVDGAAPQLVPDNVRNFVAIVKDSRRDEGGGHTDGDSGLDRLCCRCCSPLAAIAPRYDGREAVCNALLSSDPAKRRD
mmetsp:Transcript_18270/g.47741  ORF Transcript_18270/g.47741 Transcript_18270/m.47741 type:complete len:763 (-) Transcript_18270:297-2585(-)